MILNEKYYTNRYLFIGHLNVCSVWALKSSRLRPRRRGTGREPHRWTRSARLWCGHGPARMEPRPFCLHQFNNVCFRVCLNHTSDIKWTTENSSRTRTQGLSIALIFDSIEGFYIRFPVQIFYFLTNSLAWACCVGRWSQHCVLLAHIQGVHKLAILFFLSWRLHCSFLTRR